MAAFCVSFSIAAPNREDEVCVMANENSQYMNEGAWSDCPTGTLQRMLADIREARRRRVSQYVTSILVAAMLLGATVWLSVQLLDVSL